ncbi:pol protein, partial [Wolbachia endosymbiont of Drosophila ananassae]
MSWKLAIFNNKSFDAIIGQNILKPLNAVIDFYHNTITINNNIIQFQNSSPYSDEVNQIEPIKIDDKIQKILFNNLNQEENNALNKILSKFKTLIFLEGQCLSNTNIIEHQIKTVMDKPVYCKIYRYPQVHEQEIYKQIEEMLHQGIIRKSNSPYNAPLWLVPKKADNSGTKKWRIVIDYRKLNENTVDDKFPIPNIEGILDKLGRAQYFSTIDLAKGFHQILVQEQDREKTAFSTPHGHYEFNRMPFGLKNAPATFQRLINTVLKEEINKICVVYLDDVLIFSTSFSEHVGHIHTIFKKLSKANLKIQINKCKFFSKETQFLGHVLTPEGVKPNPEKVNSILQLKIPRNIKQIRAFLGITGYYRKFIKDFSQVAYPLIKCLKKDAKIDVNEPNFMIAFDKLKRIITEAPVLKYPDFKKKFQLITDASNIALGAVLQQDNHPICYASRTLNDHEKNYSSIQKDLLAIVWATAYFRPYLYGVKFDILSDHQPLS